LNLPAAEDKENDEVMQEDYDVAITHKRTSTLSQITLYIYILSEDCVYSMHMKLVVIKCFKSNFIVHYFYSLCSALH